MKRIFRAVGLLEFADILKVGDSTVYRWVHKGLIPTFQTVHGPVVAGRIANRIIRDWQRSCTQSQAARGLGLGPTRIGTMLDEGRLRGVGMLGKTRVLKSSLRQAQSRPVRKWRWNTKTARQAAKVRWNGKRGK